MEKLIFSFEWEDKFLIRMGSNPSEENFLTALKRKGLTVQWWARWALRAIKYGRFWDFGSVPNGTIAMKFMTWAFVLGHVPIRSQAELKLKELHITDLRGFCFLRTN